MNEDIMKKLNPNEVIQKNLPKIIELFVLYYGEDERERITERLQNSLIVCYSILDNRKNIIKSCINEELIGLFINEAKKSEVIKKFFSEYPEYEGVSFNESIILYNEYLTNPLLISLDKKKKLVSFLQKIVSDTTIDNIDIFSQQGKFEEVDNFLIRWKNMDVKSENQKIKEKYQPYLDEIDNFKICKKRLDAEYNKKFIDCFKDMFSEEEYSEFEKLYNNKYWHLYVSKNKIKNYWVSSLTETSLIEYFSSENAEEAKNTRYKEEHKELIEDYRLQYFSNLGLDFGVNAKKIIKNPLIRKYIYFRAKKYIPSQELIEKVKNTKKDLNEQKKLEISKNIVSVSQYREVFEEIKKMKYLNYDYSRVRNYFNKENSSTTPGIRMVDNNYILSPLIEVSIDMGDTDRTLIHECNHALEYFTDNLEKNLGDSEEKDFVCGWDLCGNSIYDLFDESINDLIALDITQLGREMGYVFFDTQKQKISEEKSYYSRTFFLSQEFFQTYKKEIIESRKNGNIQVIYDAVGKENFDELNELFIEFEKYFNLFEVEFLYRDLQENLETANTRKYYELVARRDEILVKMAEHYKGQNYSR